MNTELVKKPRDILEYVFAHEIAHLIEPTHGERFVALIDRHYRTWREARAELNELPLAAEAWSRRGGHRMTGQSLTSRGAGRNRTDE